MPDHNERFAKKDRIRRSREFARVFQDGIVIADDLLVIHAVARSGQIAVQNHSQANDRENKTSGLRLGLSISKRVGNSPTRNRWKRLIREAFRKLKSKCPNQVDLVIRPRKGAIPDYATVARSLERLLPRILRKFS